MGTGKFTQSDKLVSGSQICVGCFADSANSGRSTIEWSFKLVVGSGQ